MHVVLNTKGGGNVSQGVLAVEYAQKHPVSESMNGRQRPFPALQGKEVRRPFTLHRRDELDIGRENGKKVREDLVAQW